MFRQAPFPPFSRCRPDQLAGIVDRSQGGEPAEHVGDLLEQAWSLAIDVGLGDLELAHSRGRLRQLLLKIFLGEDGGYQSVAIAGLRVTAGAVTLEEGVGGARARRRQPR